MPARKRRAKPRSRLFDLPGAPLVMAVLRRRLKQHGRDQAALARRAGVSPQTVCDVLAGRTAPSGVLLEWLGWEIRYARIRRRRHAPVTGVGDNALRRVGAVPQPDRPDVSAAASAPEGIPE